jgi:hypothetical protein
VRIPIADADDIVGQAFDGEVLTELSVHEVRPFQLLLPILMGFDLIDENGALLASVPGEIALPITLKVQLADPTAADYRLLPDPGMYRAAFPLDVARQTNVHR